MAVIRILGLALLVSCAFVPRVRAAASWLDGAAPSASARELLVAMRDAREFGLDPAAYAADALQATAAAGLVSVQQRAQFDVQLSRAAARFVSDLHFGRVNPRDADFDLPSRARTFDTNAVLARLATTGDVRAVLASVEPPFQHYLLLKAQLANYRQLAVQAGLNELPALPAPGVREGETWAGAAALRRLLRALGDLDGPMAGGNELPLLDPQLVAALQRFQLRHGLAADGALGRRTFAALRAPLAQRVRQIELTLERWRWLPALDGPTIIVNVPQFRLFAFESNADRESQMITMEVIVGQTYPRTRTPAFAADLRYVVFQPYWDVPRDIMLREMLGKIRAQRGYLAAHDLELVGIGAGAQDAPTQQPTALQIDALAAGRARVRQRPGPNNALGPVKFMLPNAYSVYLHGTPANELFRESRRAFSHGCVRVSDPATLARFVLRNAPEEWPPERIEAAMQGERPLQVNLARPVAVRIVYGTAVASEDGRIYFLDDLYGNDAHLERLLRVAPARRQLGVPTTSGAARSRPVE